MYRSICAAVAAVAASLAVPALASADIYCVNKTSSLRVSPKRIRIGSALARLSARGGQIRFQLSEPARVTLRFVSVRTGKLQGRVRLSGHAGLNTVRFAGRLSRRKTLRPGAYRLTVLAADAAGNRAAVKRIRFTLLPRR